jgi:hypothetical protein
MILPEKRELSPGNAKGPVSDDGAFRTVLTGMLLTFHEVTSTHLERLASPPPEGGNGCGLSAARWPCGAGHAAWKP